MYIEIKEAIKTLINASVPTIKSVEFFNEQYTNTEKQKAEAYPALYIEILDPINWVQMGDGVQAGTMKIQLHTVVVNLSDFPDAVLELEQLVFLALQQNYFKYQDGKEMTSEIIRVSNTLPKKYKTMKVSKSTFEFEFYDHSAAALNTQIVTNIPMVTTVTT